MTEKLPVNILHVDDNDANRYAVTRTLVRAGFHVTEAVNGTEALAKMSSHPALVILDVRLPDIDGFEVCRRIKSNPATASTPILHLSASYITSQDKATGLEAGADAYLIRPVEPVELVATINALLRQRNTEEQLRASRELLAVAQKAADIGTFEWNVQSGAVRWTPELEALYGLPVGSFDGTLDGWRRGVHPEDLPAAEKRLQEALATRSFHVEFRVVRPDGTIRWVAARGSILPDEHGKPSRMVGVNIDITERKGIEEALRSSKLEAELANRLKDEFLATLSHELRTPLNAIVGWSALLRGGNVSAEDLGEGLETIERNARAQAQLIEDLLDVSRIISGKLRLDVQQVDLQPVLEAALASVYPAADAKGVVLQPVLSSLGTTVSGDPARLQQVVWNLLSNAIKFTPRDGRVMLVLARVGMYVEINVSDTGEGIDPEFLPHVFERFRQADSSSRREKGGLGLGLAIVRHLVELHGGTVEAASEGKGAGARFTVTLPVMAAPRSLEPQTLAAEKSERPQESGDCMPSLVGMNVLIVDDDEDSRRLVSKILEECDVRVSAVASTQEALHQVASGKFDAVISDIGMPGQDGYDLIRALRALPAERGGSVPAVALTAFARNEDRRRALLAGFQVHLPKPVDPKELLRVVGSLADKERRDSEHRA